MNANCNTYGAAAWQPLCQRIADTYDNVIGFGFEASACAMSVCRFSTCFTAVLQYMLTDLLMTAGPVNVAD